MPQTKVINIKDFTGGLNLNTDAFKLKENESPDMMNVDIDRRGGFQIRRGIKPYSTTSIAAGHPHTVWSYKAPAGTNYTLVAAGAKVYFGTGAAWTEVSTNLGEANGILSPIVVSGFSYWVRGDAQVGKLSGTTSSLMAASYNDTITPSSGNFPRGKFAAVHAGFVWVAGTYESGVHYPNRVRFSWALEFPLAAENWRSDEYIDIDDGKNGETITAIVPFGDQLIVFKGHSTYAIFGGGAESFGIVNISNTLGAVSSGGVLVTPAGLFFFDHKTGLHVYDGSKIKWVFENVWPAMRDGSIPEALIPNVRMGWVENRLWLSVPWANKPTYARGTTFVLDPSVGGAWTQFDLACGPFSSNHHDSVGAVYGASANLLYQLDVQEQYYDIVGTTSVVTVIDGHYRTNWIDVGQPAVKKRWKRLEAVLQIDKPYVLPVVAYKNYDQNIITKSFHITSDGSAAAVVNPTWDNAASDWDVSKWSSDGGIYGEVQRGTSLGVSRAISVKVGGPVMTKPTAGVSQAPIFWGVDALIVKYVPRKVR